jgi:hypothetical protein
MALLSKRSGETDPAIMVPRLADDPDYARAAELLAAFGERLHRLEREREHITLTAYLRDRPAGGNTGNDDNLRAKLARLRDEPVPELVLVARGAALKPSATIARGLDVLHGIAIPPAPDERTRLAEIDRQVQALGAAINEQTEILNGLADALTVKYARQLKPAWDALQVELFRDAQQLSRTARRVHELRREINVAGIRSCTAILSMPNVRTPLLLGDESTWDSEISGWRRILERLGIIK